MDSCMYAPGYFEREKWRKAPVKRGEDLENVETKNHLSSEHLWHRVELRATRLRTPEL